VRQSGATGDADEHAAEASAGLGTPGPVLAASASAQPTAPARTPGGAGPEPASAGMTRAGPSLPTLPATGVAIAGGLALAAAFPPTGIWPLAAAGPALLVIALWRRSLRGSFLVGLGFGLAFFIPLLSWLINVAWYAWAALAIAEAVIFAVLAIAQRLMLRLPGWPVWVAAWWVGVEAVRDRWPYAFPWGRLAMSQAQAPTVRWVKFGGPPLLTFLATRRSCCRAVRAAPSAAGQFPRSPLPPPPAWPWPAACCPLAPPPRAARPPRWPRCRGTFPTPGRCRSSWMRRP
jgi:apolipoprotein N-acyltransferase